MVFEPFCIFLQVLFSESNIDLFVCLSHVLSLFYFIFTLFFKLVLQMKYKIYFQILLVLCNNLDLCE